MQSTDGAKDNNSILSLKYDWAVPRIPTLRKSSIHRSSPVDQSIICRQENSVPAGNAGGGVLITDLDAAMIVPSINDTSKLVNLNPKVNL